MNIAIRNILGAIIFLAASQPAAALLDETSAQYLGSLESYQEPAFPTELSASGITDGYATVAFTIDEKGKIDDAVVLEASHLAFGEAVMHAFPEWRFAVSKSLRNKRDVVRFAFKREGVVTSFSQHDATRLFLDSTHASAVVVRTLPWEKLARPPERISDGLPTTNAPQRAGKAAVSFVIDTSGKVRVPIVLNATQPELGKAAIDAVKRWQFAAPTHDGMPVLVEDIRSFTFGAK